MTSIGLPKRYRRNLISGYLWTATAALVALVMTPVLVRGLGTEAYGIWVLVASFALYLEVFQFGFVRATPKFVAEYDALGDRERLRNSIATAFWILTALGGLAMVMGLGIAAVFPELFDVDPDLRGAAQVLVVLVTVNLAVSLPMDTFGGALMGFQRFDLINGTLIAVALSQAIGWAAVLALGGGLIELGIVTVAFGLAGQAARLYLARRQVPDVSVSPSRIDRAHVKPFAGLSAWFALAEISAIVVVRVDAIVVGLVVGVAAAGIYAVGQKLTLALDQLVLPAVKMFFPYSSELLAREDEAGLRRGLLTGTRISLAVAAPIALMLGLLADPILDAWVGEGFDDAALVVTYLAGAAVVAALTRTGIFMLQGMGRARMPALMSASEGALNLGLSVWLAHELGLKGVALATLIAACTMNLGIFLPYMCRQFGVPIASYLGTIGRAHLLPAGLALAVGLVVTRPSGVPALAGAALAIVATYLATFAFSGLDRDERRLLAERVRRRRRPTSPDAR